MKIIKKLPSIDDIINEFPLSDNDQMRVLQDRREVRDILEGKDNRMIVVTGPCSAWPHSAVLEYAERLTKLSDKVKDKLKLVLRVYIQKPRTAKGWTGPVNQPDPFGEPDIGEGIKYARSLMVKAIEMGLPLADEALFTHNAKGFIELLSWVAIGARSSEDQEHRIFASAISCPVGIKNSTSGSIDNGVNGIIAAQHHHTAAFNGYQVQTPGNQHAHLVLRGGLECPNYTEAHLREAKEKLEKAQVKNPAIVIDASHDNCRVNGKKVHRRQVDVVVEVMETLKNNLDLRKTVKGFMLESFIKEGNQNLDDHTVDSIDMNGLSVTDPCMGWEQTEELILKLAELV